MAAVNKTESKREPTIPVDRVAFAHEVWHGIKQHGLTYKAAAELVQRKLPHGLRISDVSLWAYAKGRSVPRHLSQVAALADVLEFPVERVMLVPDTPPVLPEPEATDPVESRRREDLLGVHVSDLGGGQALLRLSSVLPWSVAMKVVMMVKEAEETAPKSDAVGKGCAAR